MATRAIPSFHGDISIRGEWTFDYGRIQPQAGRFRPSSVEPTLTSSRSSRQFVALTRAARNVLRTRDDRGARNRTVNEKRPKLGLTSREELVFSRILLGETNKEIAQNLGCSVKNVEYHVSNILKRALAPSMKKLLADMAAAR